MTTIRVERALRGRNGKYRYRVPAYGVEGVSRQPLLDACRAVAAMGADPAKEIALFREGSADWDLRTTVGYGASKTVVERDRGGLTLESHYEPAHWREAAE
jgi:hypothetical protein